jgi:ABC-2 type transport system ATP-binding protein
VLRDLLAASVSGDVPGLTVTRPSLEDVYLSLVGAPSTAPAAPEGDLR